MARRAASRSRRGRFDNFDWRTDLNNWWRRVLYYLKLRSCLRANSEEDSGRLDPHNPIGGLNSNKLAWPQLVMPEFDNAAAGR